MVSVLGRSDGASRFIWLCAGSAAFGGGLGSSAEGIWTTLSDAKMGLASFICCNDWVHTRPQLGILYIIVFQRVL
jgi:hypothetical protein